LGRFVSRDPIEYEGSEWNLYEYLSGEPLAETDPSGLMFGWGYGKYCGWSKNGPGKPEDCLDAACKKHDNCVPTWSKCYKWFSCAVSLCIDAYKCRQAGCAKSWPNNSEKQNKCEKAALTVEMLFCAQAMIDPEEAIDKKQKCCWPLF
jgi:hypothetical protein